jgi:hypothetical protein
VAQVGDGLGAERALGVLDEEAVLVQVVEDSANVAQMLLPRAAGIRILSKKTRTKRHRKGRSRSFMSARNGVGALHKPNGITKNS